MLKITKSTKEKNETILKFNRFSNYIKCKWSKSNSKTNCQPSFFLKKKKNPITCCLKETYFNYKNIQIKDERIENTYHAKIT